VVLAFAVAALWTLWSLSGADSTVQLLTASATRGDITKAVLATGTLQPVTTVEVGSQVTGRVAWLGADFNSVVRKGQVIARLDASLFEADVTQARAALERSSAQAEQAKQELASQQRVYDRNEQLFARGLIPRADFEAAETALTNAKVNAKGVDAQVAQARAALEQDLVALSRTVIAAPINGIVINRSVDVGQTVSASVSAPTLFQIAADLASMQVNAGIDEADIGFVRRLQTVRFRVDAYPAETFMGTVSQVRIEPLLVQNVTTYNVVIDVPNRDLKLRPGMTANVSIEIARRTDALLVPNAALAFRPTADLRAALESATKVETVRRPQGDPRLTALSGDDGEGEEGPAVGRSDDVEPLLAVIEFRETDGRVWLYADGQLTPVAVRLGITDGEMTEVITGELDAGTELVTRVTAG
jgi:HlyD family secretion protein